MTGQDQARLTRFASRRCAEVSGHTALAPPAYEEREIVLALGLENIYHRWAGHPQAAQALPPTPQFVKDRLDNNRFRETGKGVYEYTSHRQRVHFTIREVTEKAAFKQALETKGLHVIYAGHSRFGRGACFGPDVENVGVRDVPPGEHWGMGTDNSVNGMFRFGFPIIAVPADKVAAKGCRVAPVPVGSGEKPSREDCHPEVRNQHSDMKQVDKSDLGHEVGQLLRPRNSPNGSVEGPFWAYEGYLLQKRRLFLLIYAGWQGTINAPMDLGATRLRCRVFCHFGCSSEKHFYPIVRDRYGHQRHGNEAYCYWTTDVADGIIALNHYLYRLLTYPEPNAFASWEPALNWTRKKTNRDLKRESLLGNGDMMFQII